MSFRESALVLHTEDVISFSTGSPSHVEFNFEEVWKYRKDPSLLAFYHVHPVGFDSYSSTDEDCIKGFNIAFGHPVYFSIVGFYDREYIFNIDHWQKSYMCIGNKIIETVNKKLDYEQLLLLKILSYGEK